jgi:hypothetical protein
MTERKLFLLRVQSSALPSADFPFRKLGLPDTLTSELNQGGWRVVNHTIGPEPTGGLLLSLYCERGG